MAQRGLREARDITRACFCSATWVADPPPAGIQAQPEVEGNATRAKAIRSTTRGWVKSVCDAQQSFAMEALGRLPCDVPQKWSDSEPRQ